MNLKENSKIFEETDIYIVSSGESSNEFQKEIGSSIEASLLNFTRREANLTLVAKLSTLTNIINNLNFTAINTKKLEASVSGTFPFGQAVVVASFSALLPNFSDVGQTDLKEIPVGGKFFNKNITSAISREVLLVTVVRLLSDVSLRPVIKDEIDSEELKIMNSLGLSMTGAFNRVGHIYQAPNSELLMSIFFKEMNKILIKFK